MNFQQKVITRWNSYFFETLNYNDFYIFRFFVFIYVFLFVGNEYISEHSIDLKTWNPISFFTFLEPHLWQTLCHYSFYTLKICAFLSSINFFYSLTSKVCALSLLLNVGYYSNFGKVFHGYQLLCVTMLLLALVHEPQKPKNLWPLQLLKLYIPSVYFVAAFNKIYNSGLDWVFSDNLYMIIVNTPGKTWFGKLLLSSSPHWCTALSFLVIFAFQLPSILAPFYKYFGFHLFVSGIMFHTGVHLVLGGHNAFLSHCVCLLILLPLSNMKDQAIAQIKSKNTSTCNLLFE